eukprot:3370505-Prymnesium_polylepis.1
MGSSPSEVRGYLELAETRIQRVPRHTAESCHRARTGMRPCVRRPVTPPASLAGTTAGRSRDAGHGSGYGRRT